jgi:hypothetical protein
MTAELKTRKGLRPAMLATAAALAAGAPLAFAAVTAAAEGQDLIEPGLWQTVSKVDMVGSEKTEKKCIRRDQVAKFMAGSPNHIYKCNYTSQNIADGQISLKGTCKDKNGIGGTVSTKGTFTRTTLNVTAHVSFLGLPFTAHLDAKRLGDCPPG